MSRGCEPKGAVLVGFMGAGKSTVGRILAKRLGAEFIDVDERIEETAGKSIREIFSSEGEKEFRERERAAIREAVSVPGRVVAAGGGAFVDEDNRRRLKGYAQVFFLDASSETVRKRLSGDVSRPLFPGKNEEDKLRDLMNSRRPAYQDADHTVGTDDMSVTEVTERILVLMARRAGPERERGRG